MSEREYIERIKANPELFGEIYETYYSKIFNYCLKRTGKFNISRDLAAETFLKAYIGFPRFHWKGIPLQSWLYRIATNEINLYHRSRKYQPRLLEEAGLVAILQQPSEPLETEREAAEDEWKKHEQFLAVRKALVTLPVKYQEVISLRYFENMKIHEISIILHKPEGTVKSLLSRGILRLKRLM